MEYVQVNSYLLEKVGEAGANTIRCDLLCPVHASSATTNQRPPCTVDLRYFGQCNTSRLRRYRMLRPVIYRLPLCPLRDCSTSAIVESAFAWHRTVQPSAAERRDTTRFLKHSPPILRLQTCRRRTSFVPSCQGLPISDHLRGHPTLFAPPFHQHDED